VIFTLQSIGGGAPYVNSVTGCATHSAALGRAAADIYQRITVTSSEVFPLWVRWRSPEALQAYLDGCDKRRQEGQLEVAIARLKDAVDRSPFNALAALQLANLYEQLAAASGTNRWETAYFRAMALVEYMRIAMLWPRLVEARYRASVAAAGLATAYDHLDREAGAAEGDAIEAMVPLPATPGDFPSRLRKLAARESSATVQLLHPVYTLIRERRMRNQFESKSRDRRALRRTVKISRHCVRMRRLNAMPDGLLWRSEARLRSLDVHLWHLRAGSASITWQARYNAACFDGLQLCPVRDDDADDGRASRMGARRRDRVERRALRNLDRAIREASGELKYDWVRYDPDMEYFRA
jgi:hypothetical protein